MERHISTINMSDYPPDSLTTSLIKNKYKISHEWKTTKFIQNQSKNARANHVSYILLTHIFK